MLILLIYWFIIISGLLLLGFTAHRLYLKLGRAGQECPSPNLDLLFFGGLIVTTIFTGWLSVFVPINDYVRIGYLVLILFLAGIQFQILSKKIKFWWSQWKSLRPSLWALIPYAAAIPLLALFMSARGIYVYDAGLYHIQNIEWIQQYAVVPGLGNLHIRFASNSMVFPLQALFEVNINGQLAYPLWSAVLIIVVGRLLFETGRAANLKSWNHAAFFAFILTAIVTVHANHFSSPSTDVIGNLCVVYIALFFASNPRSYLEKGFESWILIGLLALLPTFKLSNAVLIVFLLIMLNRLGGKKVLQMLGLCFIVVAPFVIRNYFLSGYLLFPVAGIDVFSPDWKIPQEKVETLRLIIQSWAILPGVDAQAVQDMTFKEWIPQWFNKHSIIHKVLLVLNLMSFFIWVIVLVLRKHRDLLLLHAVVLLNVVFWFFSAPDMRFAMGILILNAGMVLLYLPNFKVYLVIPRAFKLVLFLIPLISWIYLSRFEIEESIADSRYWLTPVSGFSSPELKEHKEPFVHYQPVRGDRCYDAPLPCTPENCDQLEMRGTSPGDGYRVIPDHGN